ncbi:MAG: DUF4166 domain-containing protein [Ignavibacteriae bacterium]|nr:DUF4166 domain-containing protein [Ignavibacteria bacterium]MBI3365521.1 DUF4166 domain-containing protein [Ignavibacteriota bacterium]
MSLLYERLLGPAWRDLPEPIRRAHLSSEELHGSGVFRVVHGRGLIVHFLIRLLRFPSAADAADVQLTIVRRYQGEQWVRTFGDQHLVTFQHETANGMLADTFGMIEFHSQLMIVNGAIEYHQREAGLCLGKLYLPLPRWLSPQVAAREEAVPGKDCSHVVVTFSLPFIGLLLSYEGELHVVETR